MCGQRRFDQGCQFQLTMADCECWRTLATIPALSDQLAGHDHCRILASGSVNGQMTATYLLAQQRHACNLIHIR